MTRAVTEGSQNKSKIMGKNKGAVVQQKTVTANKHVDQPASDIHEEINKLKHQMTDIQKSLELMNKRSLPYKNTKAPNTCFQCGKVGHYKQDCPMMQSQPYLSTHVPC